MANVQADTGKWAKIWIAFFWVRQAALVHFDMSAFYALCVSLSLFLKWCMFPWQSHMWIQHGSMLWTAVLKKQGLQPNSLLQILMKCIRDIACDFME